MESAIRHRRALSGPRRIGSCGLALISGLSICGCSALNPGAVKVLFPTDVAEELVNETMENAPGHVAVFFINNTRFNENVLNFLEQQGLDIDRDSDLRPRVRFRVLVQFAGGAQSTLEFVSGSSILEGVVTFVDEEGEVQTRNATPPPELRESALTNVVFICDVAQVAGATAITTTTSPVEVFVPTFLKVIRVEESEFGFIRRIVSDTIPPRFVPLLADEVNEIGTVQLQRNFGTRNLPGFPTNLTCGSVVVFELRGDLELPVVVDEQGNATLGVVTTDVNGLAGIPGRFELLVSVR